MIKAKPRKILLKILVFLSTSILLSSFIFSQELPDIKYEKYTLSNGLDVILHIDRSIPLVTVNVWYHAGSKNEKKGRTGFAHLFEHLMFEGSEHIPNYDEPMEKIGGTNNGSTTEDRTNYWENLPSNYLEMGLWLEADRMGYLLPVMTQEKLDVQRGVVQNEKRQAVDNQPYGRSDELLMQMLFPPTHPYSWSVIGSMEDLSAATLEDVKDFFRKYYTPNNASLCIAGDFDPELAKKIVDKHFSSIPPGPPVERKKAWIPALDGIKRSVVTDKIELPRIFMAWHSAPLYAPGDAELDILSDVLSSGKTSRLYKSLVYDQEIAQDISVYQDSREISGIFHIIATARFGHTLEELEKAIDVEINNLFKDGISEEEIIQAKNGREASFIRSLERAGGFGGKADRLNQYNVMLGDPGKFEWDLERYSNCSRENVLLYGKKFLDLNKRVILYFLPYGDLTGKEEKLDRTIEPAPLPEPSYSPPLIQKSSLSNGLEIYLVEDHKLPLIQINLIIKSGWTADPIEKPGAASLTADLLDEGTKTRTAMQIADSARALGAFFNTASSFDSTNINLNILKSRLDKGMDIMADVVLYPIFPNEELERKKKIYLGRIQQESRQPFMAALKLFMRKLYGVRNPYGQPLTGSGTEDSIKAITRQDLTDYYKANFSPDNAAVVIVGDITLAETKNKLNKAFGKWEKTRVHKKKIVEPNSIKSTQIYILDKPGAAQSVLVAGNLALKRNNPDFTVCEVVNNALGGMFTSRINTNLREEKAYTYGASSLFLDTRETGPFFCYTQVQTRYTKESILEIVKELRGIVGSEPLINEELENSKNNLIKSFPQNFQTFSSIAGQIDSMVTYDLPFDRWDVYVEEIKKITEEKALNTAKKYIHPESLLIVVVGDRDKIESGIRELNLGEVFILDKEN